MFILILLLPLLMWLPTITLATSSTSNTKTVCQGTSMGLSFSGSAQSRYEDLRQHYTNCTLVHGNLEVSHLTDQNDYDLSFLADIREVTGYVLIASVNAVTIPLTNLRIIRGWSLFRRRGNAHALYVAFNYRAGSPDVGLRELPLTSLHEIMAGDVYIRHNRALCFHDTVIWEDILGGGGAFQNIHAERRPQQCGDCDGSCYSEYDGLSHCFGPGPEQCQELRRLICHPECPGFCSGPGSDDCCHPECAGGCDGPGNDDCWACQNFDNDGVCVPNCPPQMIYDFNLFEMVPNPQGKYTHGTLCVDQCPDYMSVLSDSCVKECGDLMLDVAGVCQFCDGPCPKRCDGTDYYFLHGGPPTKPGSISQFEGCTIIEGSLSISNGTFLGFAYDKIPGIDVSDLSILSNVHTITGYLFIEANVQSHPLTNLNFLGNLHTIVGQELTRYGASFHLVASSLESIGLLSLQTIENGHVMIVENSRLCYVSDINWDKLTTSTTRQQRVLMVRNKNTSDCEHSGAVCHEECSLDGCWGRGAEQCLSCANDQLANGSCILSCEHQHLHYSTGNTSCSPCHTECAGSCTGLGADSCSACAHVRDGSWCRSQCTADGYADAEERDSGEDGDVMCRPCHESCDGCVGPSRHDCLRCRGSRRPYQLYGSTMEGHTRNQGC